jgi:hypothetical protein
MVNRKEALRRIAVGDIFHASALNGASFICVALQVKENAIFARRVTTQSVHEFNRTTGVEGPDENPLTIDSVAPLPLDIRDIMLGLDQKYHAGEHRRAEDPDWKMPAEDVALSMEERSGLLFIGDFYRAHPI